MDEETVGLFTEESGIDLKYTELFDNYESFAKYQADLAEKRNIGPDIITPSSWLAARLIGLGWLAGAAPRRHPQRRRTSCPTSRTRTSTRTASTPCRTSRA